MIARWRRLEPATRAAIDTLAALALTPVVILLAAWSAS